MNNKNWFLVACLLAELSACSGEEPAESRDAGADAHADGACADLAPNANPDCDACRKTWCCDEARACAMDPECKKWLDCEDACDPENDACVRSCWKNHPAPQLKALYAACKQRSCAGPCGQKACNGPSFGYQDGSEGACLECRRKHCCESFVPCAEDPGCTEALECFASCPDTQCNMGVCFDAWHLQFFAKVAPDWACRNNYCLAECKPFNDCSLVVGFGNLACPDCLHDACCAETNACSNDAECVEHWACTRSCQEPPSSTGEDVAACTRACDQAKWKGGGLDWVRAYCMRRSCGCSEPLPPSKNCGGFGWTTPSCRSCMEQNCCAEGESCGTNAACAGVHLCMESCEADPACQQKCLALIAAAGVGPYAALSMCRSAHCALQCN